MNPIASLPKGIPSEWKVLLQCAQSFAARGVQPTPVEDTNVDWATVVNLARAHGMLPLLQRSGIPEPVRSQLRDEIRVISRRNIVNTGELARVIDRLGDGGVWAIPFKGPILALQSYGDISLRAFGDLDILVKKEDLPAARELLTQDGYRTEFAPHSREDNFISDSEQVMRFVRSDTSTVIELHWQFDPRHLAFPRLATQDLWNRSEVKTLGGRSFRLLSPEDTILSLALHGLRHCWDKLEWIGCLARFIDNNPSLNWRWIQEHARMIGGERALKLALILVSDLVGKDSPIALVPDRTTRKLADRAWKVMLFGSRKHARRAIYRYPFYFSARDSVSDGSHMLAASCAQLLRPRKLWRSNRTESVQGLLRPATTARGIRENSAGPLVSIGLPFVNDSATLPIAIRSIFAQTFTNWELILMDDGSRDGSLELVRSIQDPRVRVFSDGENHGLPARLNQIATLATGRYLARMDADDVMHPERIARQVEFLESHPGVNIVGTGAILIDNAGLPFGWRPPRYVSRPLAVLRSAQLVHSSIMAMADWFRKNPYSNNYPRAEDHELWCRAWLSGCSISELPESLLFYRYQFNLSKHEGSYQGDRRILRSYGPKLLSWPTRSALAVYLRAKISFWWAASLIGIGNRIQVWRHVSMTQVERLEAGKVLLSIAETELPGSAAGFECAAGGR